jgi:hypothetical protein
VLHIVRNGIDVAESLRVRATATLGSARSKARRISAVRGHSGRLVDSVRCLKLAGGFELWERYVSTASTYANRLPGRFLEVRYEDILADPEAHVPPIFEFCNLVDAGRHELARHGHFFDRSKAYKYRDSPELRAFYESVRERMSAHGY